MAAPLVLALLFFTASLALAYTDAELSRKILGTWGVGNKGAKRMLKQLRKPKKHANKTNGEKEEAQPE